MKNIENKLKFILYLFKTQSAINKKFDINFSAHGLSFSDFVMLYHLNQANGKKLRRIDLANAVGITASGITRMLIPLEKIGLVDKEVNDRDARVSFVVLTETGKRVFEESLKSAEPAFSFSSLTDKKIKVLTGILNEIVMGL